MRAMFHALTAQRLFGLSKQALSAKGRPWRARREARSQTIDLLAIPP
jgi:hypothetical protein